MVSSGVQHSVPDDLTDHLLMFYVPDASQAFRQLLVDNGVRTGRSVVHGSAGSPDGTQKLLLQLAEGRVVETVGIPATDISGKNRLTVCVSSQVSSSAGYHKQRGTLAGHVALFYS